MRVVRRLFEEPTADFDGRWFRLSGARCRQGGTRARRPGGIPILVGGKGDRMIALAARQADEWNMWACPT